jgi:hypothetical protein
LTPAGGFWIAWPKKTSGVATDLTENIIRDVGLEEGLVDNKVCAVDDTWSGLRFVIRLKDRKPATNGKKTNKSWHDDHPMPARATLDQRMAWHLAHRKNCSCRPIPAKLASVMQAKGLI